MKRHSWPAAVVVREAAASAAGFVAVVDAEGHHADVVPVGAAVGPAPEDASVGVDVAEVVASA